MKASMLWRALAWCVLVLVFGMTVYRAKTQTIGHDEALEYEWFLDQGVAHVLWYNPANHVLFTLLAKPIVWTLGVSELTLRAPSLVGTAIYLLATYFLCRRLFGQGIMLLLSVALLCLNPQVLDLMPAARGYILGLAALAVAMYAMARPVERGEFNPDDKAWKWGSATASVALALAVIASFPNLVPAACLALTFSLVTIGGFAALLKFRERRVQQFATYFLAPGAVTGFCLLWPYLIQFRLVHLKIRYQDASMAVRDIFNDSFLYKWTDDVFNSSLSAVPAAAGSWQERTSVLGELVLLPVLFLFVAIGVLLARRAPAESRTKENAVCRIIGGAATASVVLILILHLTLKVEYPTSRYCLFLIPLFTVGGILAGKEICARFPWAYLKGVGVLLATLVVFDYALALQATSFRYMAYDVISRELYQTIANDAQRRGLTNVRVGGTWWYEPEINFYRRRYKANWMMEYEIKDKSYFWQFPSTLVPSDYDYFVFTPAGDPGLTGPRIRSIFHDGVRNITVVAIEK
jgi:hypothetical protein